MRTFEEIRALLADKLSKEKKRLKSFGTKTDSFQMANVITRHVQALMSESRNKELTRVYKFVKKHGRCDPKYELHPFLEERLKATSDMAKALQNTADKAEKERPWKYKEKDKEKDKEKKKHKHHRRHK